MTHPIADGGGPSPAQPVQPSGSMGTIGGEREIVGRERELSCVRVAIEDARTGRGSFVCVVGEPGIGKTRVADESAAIATGLGLRALWGRCWEAGGAPAYWPWLDPLASAARAISDDALCEALGAGAARLAELVPSVRQRLPDSTPSSVSAEHARFELFRSVLGLLRRAAEPSGLLLVVEDLHAADHASLLLLQCVARELRTSRVLLLATWRDRGAEAAPEVADLLASLEREGTVLGLGPLDREATQALVRNQIGALDTAVALRILDSARGHPLFLREMLRLLAQQGPEAIVTGVLPRGVREAIGQRIARLGADARALLELCAVIGDEIDRALLHGASATSAERIAASLEQATAAGILVARAGQYGFAHALLREVLYRQLTEERRSELHGRVAGALELACRDQARPPFAELAHQALRGPRELLAIGVDAAVKAAERALELFCYDDAVSGLRTALAAVEQAGSPTRERVRVLLALADACIRRGDVADGKAHCRDAALLARQAEQPEWLARAALSYGQVFAFATVDPVLVELLEEALEALPDGDSALRARLLARLGGALQPAASSEEPVTVALEAIATARRLNDPRALLETMHDGMSALMDVTKPATRLRQNLEIEQLALQLGDRERLLRTHARLIIDHLGLDELDAADARIDAFEALAHELRAPWYAWRVPLFRALRAQMHGRFEQAEQLGERAWELGRAAADPMVDRLMVCHREGFLRVAERHAEMVAFDPRGRRERAMVRYAPAWQALWSALVRVRLEQPEQARAYMDVMPEAAYPPVDNLFAIYFAAEPAAAVGSEALALRVHDMLVPHAEQSVVLGLSYYGWEGPVSRLLGLLCARLGRLDQACAHLEAAIAHAERLGALPHAARTRYELGRTQLLRRAPGDVDSARASLRAARSAAQRVPLPGLLELIDKRLATFDQLGELAPAGPESAQPAAALATSTRTTERADERGDQTKSGAAPELTLEGEYWSVCFEQRSFRLRDGLGLRYLQRLLAAPRSELHVLDLVAEGQGGGADGGDAGELLDEPARRAYRERLRELRESEREAESAGDADGAERAREEIEALSGELARALGLGGRPRRAGQAAERARSAVRRRIRHTLDRICEHDPRLAAYLERTVRTGNYCVYRPELAQA
ncbi:MAG TPA: AAA family ATPase [Polyangiales bacterium]|nr:AAA family ATPase [Polyangiales bacterium]